MYRQIGAGLSIIEPHNNLPSLYKVAVADKQLFDDPADRVLDLLDVGVHDDHAGSHDRASQFRRGSPAADPQRKKADSSGARDEMGTDGS